MSKKKLFVLKPNIPIESFKRHVDNVKDIFKQCGLAESSVLRVVVQPDTHVDEEDKPALNAFIKFLAHYKPHGIINLGDFTENSAVTHWPNQGLSPKRFKAAAVKCKEILGRIHKAAGNQCRYRRFIVGNHENWLDQYLSARTPEFYDGLDELGIDLTIENLIGVKQFNYKVIPLNEILNLGEANFIHGYYTGDSHAKKHLQVFGCNIYYGHLHDDQSYSAVSVHGTFEAQSLGCLRTLDAPFLKGKPSNWKHSFGIFEFRSDGSYTKIVPNIVDGIFSYNGKIFDGNK